MSTIDYYERARTRGASRVFYWMVRILFQTFFLLYFRYRRTGCENVPRRGAAIIASNHRSNLDPWILGTLARRPVYYVAKKELFTNPVLARLLSALGAFPVARGEGDTAMIETAKALLARGELLLIFPEGHRIRSRTLGRARRGLGRLALETGVPVIPVSVLGTDRVRKGWRVRPAKVRVRVGKSMQFPRVDSATPQMANGVTDRVWRCIELQWESIGGAPPKRSEPAEPALASAT